MSAAGAIRAGAAYVEVFLEQNRITQGLTALQTKLRGWSASLGKIGAESYGGELPGPLGAIARFASSPAGMFAGLLTAAKMAASGGSAIADLAEKAGTSVEAISALGYAARRNDVPIEELAAGIKKMQVNITDAARGGKQGQEALAAIGLTADQLGRLLPEEQFRLLADRIAAIQNPTERAAAAVKIFGRTGTELLPLLLQGSDGIAKWEARARALGLVASGDAARGARLLLPAWRHDRRDARQCQCHRRGAGARTYPRSTGSSRELRPCGIGSRTTRSWWSRPFRSPEPSSPAAWPSASWQESWGCSAAASACCWFHSEYWAAWWAPSGLCWPGRFPPW